MITAVEIGLGLVHRKLLYCDAGIVDQHADRPKRSLGAVDRPRDRGRIGNVHCHGGGPAALAADFFLQALQLVRLPRRQHHRGAPRGQYARKLPPEPLRGSGNQNNLMADIE